MSRIGSQSLWPFGANESKYEKCLNITEEIYKRINITFQIKQLETGTQSDVSDHSDQIDSNDLSNDTDLFACDKSDSIPSSTEAEKPTKTCDKYINNNNNEETKFNKPIVVYKRPKKRFRKRVKKRQSKPSQTDSDGSSDEALPLSRIIDIDTKNTIDPTIDTDKCESPDHVMGVPPCGIVTKDLKPKLLSSDIRNQTRKNVEKLILKKEISGITEKTGNTVIKYEIKDTGKNEGEKDRIILKVCTLCNLSFRGERGLRRHISMSHVMPEEKN